MRQASWSTGGLVVYKSARLFGAFSFPSGWYGPWIRGLRDGWPAPSVHVGRGRARGRGVQCGPVLLSSLWMACLVTPRAAPWVAKDDSRLVSPWKS